MATSLPRLLLLLTVGLFPVAATATTLLGTLEKFTGEVAVRAPDAEQWRPARTGEKLTTATRLRTGATGSAVFTFQDGTILRVHPSSELILRSRGGERDLSGRIVLFFGRVWNKVQTVTGGKPRFEVNTPSAVAGVRGTEFTVAVGADGATRVVVDRGTVAVGHEDRSVDVTGSFESQVAADGTITPAAAVTGPIDWARWFQQRAEQLREEGERVAHHISDRLRAGTSRVRRLRAEQERLVRAITTLRQELVNSDRPELREQIRHHLDELEKVTGRLLDLRDRLEGSFGYFHHLATLVQGSFGDTVQGREFILRELRILRDIEASFNDLIAEGTALSVDDMEKMIEEMPAGHGSLKEEPGSTRDLFGDPPSGGGTEQL